MFAGNQGQGVSKACIFKIGIFNVVSSQKTCRCHRKRNSQRISLGYKKNTIPMILSNPVGWVRDGDIQIFTYYIKV